MPNTTNKGYSVQTVGSNSGTWGAGATTALNEGVFEIMDLNMGGVVNKALTNVNVTLSATESRNLLVRCTGTLTGAVQITTSCIGFFVVENRTTGSFALTIYNGAGSAIECPQGYAVLIVADSTNGCRLGNDNPGEVFNASGASHSTGLVPDPGATAGTSKYLREDATWQVPPFQWAPGGRLTLQTGEPVSLLNVSGTPNVFYTAMNGNTVPVFNGTVFVPATITSGQMTLVLNNPNHAASTNYDVFFFLNGSTPVIGTGPPWSTPTSRGTGAGTTQLALVNGIWTNAVAVTARNNATTYAVSAGYATYLGTIRTASTAGTTDDTTSNRFVFNAYNAVRRPLQINEGTSSWTYSSDTTWRQANGSASNQFGIVIGLLGNAPRFDVAVSLANSTSNNRCAVGIGLNSTTSNSAQLYGNTAPSSGGPVTAHYHGYPGLGYFNIAWLEIGIVTFRGTDSTSFLTSGMIGEVWA